MPNRFLKESICTSDNIDRLTDFQETFFYRLMVNCDDFGRFDARPKILASMLYPLRSISVETVQQTLEALQDADLITVYVVGGHPYLQMKTWGKHQQTRAIKSKYPDPTEGQMITSDNNCYQAISDDNKCPRIRNTYSYNDIRNTITNTARACARDAAADDDDLRKTQDEQNRVLDAAEDAGFLRSNSVRAKLIALYAENGLEKMLEGIGSCVQHGVVNLAYLEAALKGEPKKPKEAAKLPAQDYHQRDYSDAQEEAFDRMMELAKEMG